MLCPNQSVDFAAARDLLSRMADGAIAVIERKALKRIAKSSPDAACRSLANLCIVLHYPRVSQLCDYDGGWDDESQAPNESRFPDDVAQYPVSRLATRSTGPLPKLPGRATTLGEAWAIAQMNVMRLERPRRPRSAKREEIAYADVAHLHGESVAKVRNDRRKRIAAMGRLRRIALGGIRPSEARTLTPYLSHGASMLLASGAPIDPAAWLVALGRRIVRRFEVCTPEDRRRRKADRAREALDRMKILLKRAGASEAQLAAVDMLAARVG